MLVRALSFPLSNVGPEEKYFLVRFVQCFGIADPVSLGVKELATRFGLSDRQVSKSLAALLGRGVLALSSTPDGGGRPKRSYRLQDAFVKALNKPPQKPSKSYYPPPFNEIHKEAIGRLLRHENSKTGQQSTKLEPGDGAADLAAQMRARRQSGRLSVVNRLLLGVLLCYADRFGVVRDLGSSALREATGLNQERLSNRVRQLVNQGLIRAYVAGVSSTVLGKKESSTYFLNLHHPELADHRSDIVVLVVETEHSSEEDKLQYADMIWKGARDVRRFPAAFEGEAVGEFFRLFMGQRDYFYRLLELKLETYAAQLLSSHWHALSTGTLIEVPALRMRIREDFLNPAEPPEPISPSSEEERSPSLVEKMLYGLSIKLAVRIQTMIISTPDLPLESTDFVIIPQAPDVGYRRFVILAHPRSPCFLRGCLVIRTSQNLTNHTEGADKVPSATIQRFSTVAEIPLEDQYRYGLRIRPAK